MVLDKLAELGREPRPNDCRKIRGLPARYEVYRVELGGSHRILYQIKDEAAWILVVKVADRKDVHGGLLHSELCGHGTLSESGLDTGCNESRTEFELWAGGLSKSQKLRVFGLPSGRDVLSISCLPYPLQVVSHAPVSCLPL